MKIVNHTPHDVIVLHAGERYEFPRSGVVARLEEEREEWPALDGMPTTAISYGEISGLPEPMYLREITPLEQEDHYRLKAEDYEVVYIVSALVGPVAAERGRHDIIAPDTGKAIRDEKGTIIGVPGFVRY